MRIVTFRRDGVQRAGVLSGEHVHAFPRDYDTRAVVGLGLAGALALGERTVAETDPLPLRQVRLCAPIRPASIRDFVTFEAHVAGVRRSVDGASGVPAAWYDAPTFYFANPHTVIGPDDPAVFPAGSTDWDFELEVAAVLGAGGTSLTTEQAGAAIFGYTVLNDWSARDLQSREMRVGLGPAKGKDFASTLGPCIVTADEIQPYADSTGLLDLWCTASVNGAEIGRDVLSHMGWGFPSLVAYASRDSRVVPGDVLGSGTAGNGGCLAELWGRNGTRTPPPLREGDVVTLSVQGIGSVSNRVTAGPPAPPLPAVRRHEQIQR
jgi:2-keto-4-pentenoate hydratase/2-oxohepta-3-ene-1,7-dioic acid hydratase in catechol pathway